jgi:hypothetical protein
MIVFNHPDLGPLVVKNMFDRIGNETGCVDEAIVVVAALPDGQFIASVVYAGELEKGAVQ